MKNTLPFFLVLSLVFVANGFSAIKLTYTEPVKNGDQLHLEISEVPANTGVKYILLMKRNADVDNWQEYVLLGHEDLRTSSNGTVTGRVTVGQLDVNDAQATLWVVLENGNIIMLQEHFTVSGDEEEIFSPMDAGTFTISDSTGGLFEVADTAKATGSGFTANDPIFFAIFEEYDANDSLVTSHPASFNNLSVDGSGNLSGFAVRDGSSFNSSTVKIILRIAFQFSGNIPSSNSLPINESNPPDLIQASAFDLDTIRLVFDEPVSEAGNAHNNFTITGSSATPSDLIAVGTQPTANWNLVLSPGLSDRGVSGVTIAYAEGSATDSLADAAGNEVADTAGVIVQDSIPPNVTILRDSSNSVALSIGEFIGSSTYLLRARVADGNNDSSLDSLRFEGSDDGSNWTRIGTDATPTVSGSDADFEASWDIQTVSKFKMLRARAFDGNGNETSSAVVGSATDGFNDNFEDTYRAIITQVVPDTIGASSGAIRARLTVKFQNNYGDVVNTTGSNLLLRFTENSTTTELWWDAASGGNSFSNQIDLSINSSSDSGNVWYSNTTAGGPNTLVLTEPAGNFTANNGVVSADGKTITVTVSNVVTVSSPSPAVDSNIDTTASAGDLTLQAQVSDGEDGSVGDDFRILWGFNSTGVGGSYGITDTSGNLTPPGGGGTISHTIPAAQLQNLGAPYDYLFWWVENLSADPNATILDGMPISSDPARLIINPNLVTEAGVSGGDVSGGSLIPGQNNQELVSIKFASNPSAATIQITGLVFDKSGSAGTNDIAAFNLYKDGGTLGQFNSGLDLLLQTVSFQGGSTVSFNNINLQVSGASDYILVTVDIKSGANPSNTVGLNLNNPGSITLGDNVINGPADAITKDNFSNLGTIGDVPLPVQLAAFTATDGYGRITLQWETVSELNNEGFYLYRSQEPDRGFEQLNYEIIPGHGNSNAAHTYIHTDEDVQENETYYYQLVSKDFNGETFAYGSIVSATVLEMPQIFEIAQNYPNPFNPETHFRFSIAEPSRASLKIYNVLGQKIRTIFDNRSFEVGVYDEFSWNATDDFGTQVANGIYYYEFQIPGQSVRQVKKMILLK